MAPVLRIRDLCVEYRTPEGTVAAVRHFSLDLAAGETTALVGESGAGRTSVGLSVLGLVPHPGAITGGAIRLRDRDERDLVGASGQDLRAVRGSAVSMIFQDPVAGLNPVIEVGGADRGDHREPSRSVEEGGAGGGAGGAGDDAAAGSEADRAGLPGGAIGRDVPAGDDRDRDRAGSGGADRGRTDVGAGRDGAGADPGRAGPAATGARNGDSVDHARPGSGGADRRPHGGALRGGAAGGGGDACDLPRAAASVHLVVAGHAAASGPGARPDAAADPWCAARPAHIGRPLLVPAALSEGAHHVPARAGAAHEGGRGRRGSGWPVTTPWRPRPAERSSPLLGGQAVAAGAPAARSTTSNSRATSWGRPPGRSDQ